VATPLPPIDTDHVAGFWTRFLATGVVDRSTPVPETVEPFGDSVELADELIGLVVHGPKRATAGALVEYELEGASLPKPGAISIATDGAGRARAILRTTEVRVGPLTSVDESFAWDEGEGDRTRSWWLDAHEAFLRRYLPTIGDDFDPDVATVFERFEVLFAELRDPDMSSVPASALLVEDLMVREPSESPARRANSSPLDLVQVMASARSRSTPGCPAPRAGVLVSRSIASGRA
jgi:uncharacterized protein YhfF